MKKKKIISAKIEKLKEEKHDTILSWKKTIHSRYSVLAIFIAIIISMISIRSFLIKTIVILVLIIIYIAIDNAYIAPEINKKEKNIHRLSKQIMMLYDSLALEQD